DITFSDNHHELEEVHLEIYPATGNKPDQITAHRAIYLPGETAEKDARIWFAGDVQIETRDALTAKTEKIEYDQGKEIGETSLPISFERENVSGRATGAVLDNKNKRLDLQKDVEIVVQPDAKAAAAQKSPARSKPVTIHAGHAVFDQAQMHLTFTGGATAEQERDVMSGDQMSASLSAQKKVQKIEARGNSYLRSMEEGHAAEVHAEDMDFFFDGNQQLQRTTATRDVKARSLDADSQAEITGANSLQVDFQQQGERSLLKEMNAGGGRSVLTLAAPQSRAADPHAANKRLTADSLKLVWRATGRDLESAEAVGNAELVIEPVQKGAKADRKTLNAQRFDCEFYETGNIAKQFTATGGEVRAVLDPLQPSEKRGQRVLTSQKMVATFVRETQDVERFDAEGDAKFNEMDRNGHAQDVTYTASDETVKLRGGEPVVWDSRARMKALEIDSDMGNKISYGRGKAATTYYSQEQTNGAAPFQKVKSPVFIVSDRAEIRHETGVGIYTGGARMWQDDNFVRADAITLYRDTKRMEAAGHVQSALYQARRKGTGGASTVVPAFATANSMTYADDTRVLHYEGMVDIKQDTDRIRSGVADIYLMKETNEVEKSVAERDVIVTQPGRQGTGNWAEYTAADDTVVLKGGPARVVDTDQGTVEGSRLTVYMSENKVVADDERGPQTGRVRTTHKVRKQ
ncbi:MAG: LPS export ABC transporter periplasmic protein LptC, partial [Acidobacteriota bacterium]|nr:LPS export ABC transporter periplasmic protein LptC [Acidobacteriota bacterium]